MTRSVKTIDRNRHSPRMENVGRVTVSLRSIQPVLMYIAAHGHDATDLIRRHGLNPASFRDPEARLPHAAAIGLWQTAAELTGDYDLGLHIAQAIQPGQFGALEYVLRTSGNLGEAFGRLSRYHRLLHDAASVELEIKDGCAVLSHRLPLPGGAPRHVSEFILAAWLLTSRQATGTDCTPIHVCFPHPAPADTSEHRKTFDCPLKFEQRRSELVFRRSALELPLLKSDPILQGIVEAQVVWLLAKLPTAEATIDAIRRLLAEELSKGQPRLEQLASRLHMSSRTLHRRLEEEGTNFRRVLSEVRRELALRHLMEGRLAIGEIAFLLGFSEVSAFHRAFKHWTGYTPHTYRAMRPGVQDPKRGC